MLFWYLKDVMVDTVALTKVIEPEVEALGYRLVRVAMIGGTSDPTGDGGAAGRAVGAGAAAGSGAGADGSAASESVMRIYAGSRSRPIAQLCFPVP